MNEPEALLRRVRGEFVEMPGLRLTVVQAARLWGLERATCEAVIDALVGSSFLRLTTSGVVMRTDHESTDRAAQAEEVRQRHRTDEMHRGIHDLQDRVPVADRNPEDQAAQVQERDAVPGGEEKADREET